MVYTDKMLLNTSVVLKGSFSVENSWSWKPWDFLQFLILVSQATPTYNNNNNLSAHITVEETIQPEPQHFIGVAQY